MSSGTTLLMISEKTQEARSEREQPRYTRTASGNFGIAGYTGFRVTVSLERRKFRNGCTS